MKQIPIFFTFDENSVVAAAVAFHSLLRNSAPGYFYKLHVLHTSISAASQRRLQEVAGRFPNASLQFTDVSRYDDDERIRHQKSHYSMEIYYKLIAADLFPQYDRILCSDVDVVFTGDISASYFLFPDEDFYYAGVGQVLESGRMKAYGTAFNDQEKEVLQKEIAANYMLLNLAAMRADGLQHRLTDYYKQNYHRLVLPEQDCLILCCWPRVRYMPMECVVCNTDYRTPPQAARFFRGNPSLPQDEAECRAQYAHALKHPVQLHYVGAEKPWNAWPVPKQRLWLAMLGEAGFTGQYLKALPAFIGQRLKRYSLKRFLRKVRRAISGWQTTENK